MSILRTERHKQIRQHYKVCESKISQSLWKMYLKVKNILHFNCSLWLRHWWRAMRLWVKWRRSDLSAAYAADIHIWVRVCGFINIYKRFSVETLVWVAGTFWMSFINFVTVLFYLFRSKLAVCVCLALPALSISSSNWLFSCQRISTHWECVCCVSGLMVC